MDYDTFKNTMLALVAVAVVTFVAGTLVLIGGSEICERWQDARRRRAMCNGMEEED